jgi:hypothetical protein
VASLPFFDAGSRLVYNPDGRPAANTVGVLYGDSAGVTLAEIYVDNAGVRGALITSATVVTDAHGQLPTPTWGPASGQDRLWIRVNGGPLWPVDADSNARLDALEAGGGGGGAVASVAGKTGVVTLVAADVTGVETTSGAQAKADAVSSALTAHAAATTSAHGIADTSVLETTSGAQAKATAAQLAAQANAALRNNNLSDLSDAAVARSNLLLGNAATRNVGGAGGAVPDGADPRFSDARTPLAHASTHGTGGADPITLAQARITGLDTTLAAKADLVAGKVPTAQIPAIAINTTFTVASQAAMLALAASQGDVAIRTDFSPAHSYQLAAADPTVLGNWISVNLGGVVSVNMQSGVIVLAAADVGAPATSRQINTGGGLTGGGDLTADRTIAVALGTSAGTVTEGNDARVVGALQAGSNLLDLNSVTSARTNLGLANSATRPVGTASGTVAAGDDTRIVNAVQAPSNLSDLPSASTARTNLGLGNVNNTSDVGKPISAATQTALTNLAIPGHGVVVVAEAPVTPLQYGAVGDGTTIDDAAFTAMMAALPSFGGHIYIPPNYNFRLTTPIVLKDKSRWSGAGVTSQITNGVTDVFQATLNLSLMHFHDMRLNAGTGGGHVFGLGAYGMSKSHLDNLMFAVGSANKSSLSAALWLDNTFQRCSLYGGNNRSAPMISVVSSTNNLADNTFSDLVLTDALLPTTWAIWLEETSPSLALANRLLRINFENPAGGAITMRGHLEYVLEDIQLWDLASTATNHLIYTAQSGGTVKSNRGGRISRVHRTSGSLGVGLNDIQLGSFGTDFDTVITQLHGTGSAIMRVDMAHNIGCRVEDCGLNVSIQQYTPLYAIGAAAGTSATAVVSPLVPGLYAAGMTLTTGTSPTAGVLVSVSANVGGWMSSAPVTVLIQPHNAAAVAAGLYVSGISAAGFSISAANTPATSTALNLAYRVVQNVAG